MSIADLFTGLYAANAIQAALLRRERTGEGAFIDCALLDAQVAVLGYQARQLPRQRTGGRARRQRHPTIVPYDVFPVADGDIIIATGNDGQFRKLCVALGAPDARGRCAVTRPTRDRVANRGAAHRRCSRDLTRASTRRGSAGEA